MGCIYCDSHQSKDSFEIRPDSTYNDGLLFEDELQKRIPNYEGEASLSDKESRIYCPVCKSVWVLEVYAHMLPPDPAPWYYDVAMKVEE